MDCRLLLRALLVGLAVAAPIGPIGILVVKRSLTRGGLHGFLTGLGAAAADACFALVAALGLATVASLHGPLTNALRIGGGLFLCCLAARTFVRSTKRAEGADPPVALARAFLSALLLTLSSPITILSFAAIATSLGVRATAPLDGATLVFGVFFGSAAWWAFLSATVARVKKKVPEAALSWLDRGSALVLAGFGVVALFS